MIFRRIGIIQLRHGLERAFGLGADAGGRPKSRVDREIVHPDLHLMSLKLSDAGGIVVERGGVVRRGDEGVGARDGRGVLVRHAKAQSRCGIRSGKQQQRDQEQGDLENRSWRRIQASVAGCGMRGV